LPAPEEPTMATCCPGLISRETLFSTNLECALYLNDTSCREIAGINSDGSSGMIKYTYDGIFNHTTSQSEIFEKSVKCLEEFMLFRAY
jgi:hypothetical protein